ncbi:uncharacterized protein LOC107809047 isoform X2 [Nicotiana tabacum]|uniref:Uncharacterized protein LOC107809047 isoform X2 n=1 Tax=Nicotiana tabacum TaxID=4097 RepID=A0A1S4BJQ9_TOBAC|nr:PREDICTED: uncharacterized protein LOC107809047 isoform X2 [Nicotiana tabacum]
MAIIALQIFLSLLSSHSSCSYRYQENRFYRNLADAGSLYQKVNTQVVPNSVSPMSEKLHCLPVSQFPPFRFLRFLILSLHFRKFFRLDRCFFFERERASTIPKGYPDLRTIDSLEFRVDGHQFEVLERRWSLLRNFRARYISDWSFGHKGTTIEGTLGVSFIP